MKGLRCSFPPYYVAAMAADGEPIAALPGDTFGMLERGLAPSAGQVRGTLRRLRKKLRWSRAMLAAFIGVDPSVLRRWEVGDRVPSAAARRLIWLLDLLAREPEKIKSAMDLIFWGRGEQLSRFAAEV